jgi:hypothetical protein
MSFQDFARSHGLLVDDVIMDKWVRVGTEDHPRKQNGAYIFDAVDFSKNLVITKTG